MEVNRIQRKQVIEWSVLEDVLRGCDSSSNDNSELTDEYSFVNDCEISYGSYSHWTQLQQSDTRAKSSVSYSREAPGYSGVTAWDHQESMNYGNESDLDARYLSGNEQEDNDAIAVNSETVYDEHPTPGYAYCTQEKFQPNYVGGDEVTQVLNDKWLLVKTNNPQSESKNMAQNTYNLYNAMGYNNGHGGNSKPLLPLPVSIERDELDNEFVPMTVDNCNSYSDSFNQYENNDATKYDNLQAGDSSSNAAYYSGLVPAKRKCLLDDYGQLIDPHAGASQQPQASAQKRSLLGDYNSCNQTANYPDMFYAEQNGIGNGPKKCSPENIKKPLLAHPPSHAFNSNLHHVVVASSAKSQGMPVSSLGTSFSSPPHPPPQSSLPESAVNQNRISNVCHREEKSALASASISGFAYSNGIKELTASVTAESHNVGGGGSTNSPEDAGNAVVSDVSESSPDILSTTNLMNIRSGACRNLFERFGMLPHDRNIPADSTADADDRSNWDASNIGASNADNRGGVQQPPASHANGIGSSEDDDDLKVPMESIAYMFNGKPKVFVPILENDYICSKDYSKAHKEARRMVCECVPPSPEEDGDTRGCLEDCLNRMLFIECGSRCPCGSRCANKRFQLREYPRLAVFRASHKGCGLMAMEFIPRGTFVTEYVGEILDYEQFKARTDQYHDEKRKDFYFMSLTADEMIDATQKGNMSRFMNHSCDPNCETQKWTVNGRLRVGLFAVRNIEKDEEVTFDYQFERYGETAQKCYCGTAKCRGVIGGDKVVTLRQQMTEWPGDEEEEKTEGRSHRSRRDRFSDEVLNDEISKLVKGKTGLRKREQVLDVCRLMVRAETADHRLSLLHVLKDTKETALLRLFVDLHGLSLMWSWMVDTSADCYDLKKQIMATLKALPVPSKAALRDSRVLSQVERWAATPNNSDQSNKTRDASDGSTPELSADNNKPWLLRHLSQTIGDTPSSDGDAGDIVEAIGDEKIKTKRSTVRHRLGSLPGLGRKQCSMETSDSETSESPADFSALAQDLLDSWSGLPDELYKIPRKKIESGKKQEDETLLINSSQRSALSREPSNGRSELPNNIPKDDKDTSGRKQQRRSSTSLGNGPKSGLLPIPGQMSKDERRRQFEEQVRAEEQKKKEEEELKLANQRRAEFELHQAKQKREELEAERHKAVLFPHGPRSTSLDGSNQTSAVELPATKGLVDNEQTTSGTKVTKPSSASSLSSSKSKSSSSSAKVLTSSSSTSRSSEKTSKSANGSSATKAAANIKTESASRHHIASTSKHDLMEADTTSEVAKKVAFKDKISQHVIHCLKTYRQKDCKVGRITNNEDFKYLARWLTHAVMEKELKRCHSFDRLKVTDGVRTKAKEFIDKYMSRSGPTFNKTSAHARSAAKLNATMP